MYKYNDNEVIHLDVFVIHSGANYDTVVDEMTKAKNRNYRFNYIILSNGGPFWKKGAARKIKKSQIVLVVLGEESHKSENIAWEIEKARELDKPIYIVKLTQSCPIHKALENDLRFRTPEISEDCHVKLQDLPSLIDQLENVKYPIFNECNCADSHMLLLEQYKIILQTSEDLINRRQGISNFYLSVHSVMIGAITAILVLDIGLFAKLLVGLTFAVIGIVLSVSWIELLESYGRLNASKIKVLSAIEQKLPVSFFDAEWAILSNRTQKQQYKSFTNFEKTIPKVFIGTYIAVLLIFCLLCLFSI